MKMHTRSKNAPLRSIRPAARKRLSVAVENLGISHADVSHHAADRGLTTSKPTSTTTPPRDREWQPSLEGIGAFPIDGVSHPIDVLALEETTSNSATVQPIVDDLNSFYGAGTYAQSPLQLTEVNGDPTPVTAPAR